MIRLFTPDNMAGRTSVTFTGDPAHYLLNVVRLAPGEAFAVVDAVGGQYELVADELSSGEVTARVVRPLDGPAPPRLQLDLYQALLKGGNFELVVRKSVELGVGRITPVITRRTVVRPPAGRQGERLHRWNRVALEAARQCGRTDIPQVAEPVEWKDALAHWQAARAPGLLPYEALAGTQEHGLRETLAGLKQATRLGVFIGPEGGFEPSEAQAGLDAGLQPVSLGPRILRAETAALALCAVIMYELG